MAWFFKYATYATYFFQILLKHHLPLTIPVKTQVLSFYSTINWYLHVSEFLGKNIQEKFGIESGVYSRIKNEKTRKVVQWQRFTVYLYLKLP